MPRTKQTPLSRIRKEDSKDRPPTARHKQVYEERYENAHREERRAKARDYQRRRRAAVKMLSDEQQAEERRKASQYSANYRQTHRFELMMVERRRRNSSDPERSLRTSSLRFPDQVDAMGHMLHEMRNKELVARREAQGGAAGSKAGGSKAGGVKQRRP